MLQRRPLALVRRLGPGLISGASDNDPTTVASLAVIGARPASACSGCVVLVIPMLVVVQVISAAIGTVCQKGLEDVIGASSAASGPVSPCSLCSRST